MPIERPPDLVLVSEVLGNGAALLLTAVLLLLIVRTARTNLAMWLGAFCALLWIGGGLSGTLLILAGASPQSSTVWITHLAVLASGTIFPHQLSSALAPSRTGGRLACAFQALVADCGRRHGRPDHGGSDRDG